MHLQQILGLGTANLGEFRPFLMFVASTSCLPSLKPSVAPPDNCSTAASARPGLLLLQYSTTSCCTKQCVALHQNKDLEGDEAGQDTI